MLARLGMLGMVTVGLLSACGGSPPPPPPPLPKTMGEQAAPSLAELRFPDDVDHRLIDMGQAQQRFCAPEHLLVQTHDAVRFDGSKLIVDTWVTNPQATAFALVVMPVGGSFPYGGDSPLALRFSRASQEALQYVGPTFPPEPPRPMEIMLPPRSRVSFSAQIDLGNYEYSGQPQIELEWTFHYLQGQSPTGVVSAGLPAR